MSQSKQAVAVVERCTIVLADGLPAGLAANGAALLALTAGQRYPALIGEAFRDAAGQSFPGMCPSGIPVLNASAATLAAIHVLADPTQVEVLVLPAYAQQTTRYSALLDRLAGEAVGEWPLAGIMLIGPAKNVRALTRDLPLWGAG